MNAPITPNEFQRLLALSEYDLDYASLEKQFADLTNLAAKVAGSQVSLVNIIDSYTQWSVAATGLPTIQMDRQDAVCNYTILGLENFEVKDLFEDERFRDKFYVKGEPHMRYYWGIPLTNPQGYNLGALCVMDPQEKDITPEKVELLKLIGKEIVNRLEILKSVQGLQEDIKDLKNDKKKVAHDIRGPLAGIVGLAEIIQMQGNQNKLEDILEFITLIQRSGRSLLELADQIMKDEDQALKITSAHLFNLEELKEKLQDLFGAQARQKNIFLTVSLIGENRAIKFPKTKLLQIIGNIISNALKFTKENGTVDVTLELAQVVNAYELITQVKDTGVGMREEKIQEVMQGGTTSSEGTGGESGYGFGLSLVKYLIDSMNGSLEISSQVGVFTHFKVKIPVTNQ
ncbi:MAG: GAF domain-containing sensor histidine kinase [Mongoliitalea sp.]